MVTRVLLALIALFGLPYLVYLQIQAASAFKMLTVEQLTATGIQGLSYDRHYAMVLHFAVMPSFIALPIFLCGKQWRGSDGLLAAVGTTVLTFALLEMWRRLAQFPEPQVLNGRTTLVGWLHGLYMLPELWTFLMVFVWTREPPPVLLLMLTAITPAYLFLGQHLYLALLNQGGAATTLAGPSFKNPVAWIGIVAITSLVAWRSYVLIPSAFWRALE